MKYIGSKSKLAKYIVPILQQIIDKYNIGCYLEPFVGGANIIDKIKCKIKLGTDIDLIPITLLKEIPQNPNLLNSLPERLTKEHYYDVRDNCAKYQHWYFAAIMLFGSYNARVYGGCYGAEARTKNGGYRNYYKESINNFKKQLPSLKETTFLCGDYRDTKLVEKSLIYCDPPYASGVGYKTEFNNVEFWDWAREQSKTHLVVVSENKAPEDFECIWELKTNSGLNNRKKIEKTERLFVYKGGIFNERLERECKQHL
uniref:site-specific DNA-methyltransferase (adenine-specific) n=1 Tax=Myoviridae sp. ctRRy11 TaxID=2826651 RepID=A0A8S5MYA8_9CAUD|nr:MAG TPA: Site-specific DNA methylase [Myoviridae sp. ctRRy11]